MKPYTVTKTTPIPRKEEFGDRFTYEQNIIDNATSYEIVLKLSMNRYWREEAITFDEAMRKGKFMVDCDNTHKYHALVYAFKEPYQAFVGSILPGGIWKERIKK